MRITIFSTVMILVSGCFGYGQHVDLTRHVVLDSANKTATLKISPGKATVIFVLGAECPISQKYVPAIESIKRSFGDKINFVGIFPNQSSPAEVIAFIKEYDLSFPCFIDRDMTLIRQLRTTVTPESFLVAPDQTVRYAGAIDNWFYELGRYRLKVTEHYLTEAIEAFLGGKEITVPRTKAIGCPVPASGEPDKSNHSHH